MKTPIQKSKFTIGLILIVQAVTFLIISLAQFKKRKSLAGACLAISALSGIIGTVDEKRLGSYIGAGIGGLYSFVENRAF